MSLLDKEAVKRARKALKDFDQSLSVIILKDSARTAQDAASSLNCEVGAIVKSLLFRTEDYFVLSLIAGDKRCSLNKLKILIDNSLVRFKELYAAAGHPNCVFKIDIKKLQKITNGEINELTE